MFDDYTLSRAAACLEAARRIGATITTVESCTGGLVAAALTAVPGSSDVVDGGVVTYSNDAKVRLGVPPALIAAHGAVSREVATAMAEAGCAAAGDRGVAVAVTGVAGPSGGSPLKPVGLVHFAAAGRGAVLHHEHRFGDVGRDGVRHVSVGAALTLLTELLMR
ncbi:CinA family protein [Acuticoccus sp.]|uniref:CinA family protein n=1 Tax=Acuticoccus sp. TaxID=1904378 RepID=UPI003B5278A7